MRSCVRNSVRVQIPLTRTRERVRNYLQLTVLCGGTITQICLGYLVRAICYSLKNRQHTKVYRNDGRTATAEKKTSKHSTAHTHTRFGHLPQNRTHARTHTAPRVCNAHLNQLIVLLTGGERARRPACGGCANRAHERALESARRCRCHADFALVRINIYANEVSLHNTDRGTPEMLHELYSRTQPGGARAQIRNE